MTKLTPTTAAASSPDKSGRRGHTHHHHRRSYLEIESYIPAYLKRYIHPYNDEFCYSRTYHFRLLAQLCAEGFLPIASSNGIMLPKLHNERCVIALPDKLHVSKSIRKKSNRFRFTVNHDFEAVVEQCREQHGLRCWLYPPLVQVFREIHESGQVNAVIVPNNEGGSGRGGVAAAVPGTAQAESQRRRESPVRLYSIEVWNEETGALVAGELGYTVGSVYTSLTGFSNQDSAGSVQLAALGRLLSALGFSLWDLGMDMDYKQSLGSSLMPRCAFVEHLHHVRVTHGHLKLPLSDAVLGRGGPWNCRTIIDDAPSVLTNNDTTQSSPPPPSKRVGSGAAMEQKSTSTSSTALSSPTSSKARSKPPPVEASGLSQSTKKKRG